MSAAATPAAPEWIPGPLGGTVTALPGSAGGRRHKLGVPYWNGPAGPLSEFVNLPPRPERTALNEKRRQFTAVHLPAQLNTAFATPDELHFFECTRGTRDDIQEREFYVQGEYIVECDTYSGLWFHAPANTFESSWFACERGEWEARGVDATPMAECEEGTAAFEPPACSSSEQGGTNLNVAYWGSDAFPTVAAVESVPPSLVSMAGARIWDLAPLTRQGGAPRPEAFALMWGEINMTYKDRSGRFIREQPVIDMPELRDMMCVSYSTARGE